MTRHTSCGQRYLKVDAEWYKEHSWLEETELMVSERHLTKQVNFHRMMIQVTLDQPMNDQSV